MRQLITVSRLLLLLGGLLLFTPLHAQQFFSDIPADDRDKLSFIEVASNQLMEGYPDGTFQPEATVRRDESVMVMARLLRTSLRGFMVLSPAQCTTAQPPAIPVNHWAYTAAMYLVEQGMWDSQLDTVRLREPVTRGELLGFVARMLHAGVPQTAEQASAELHERGLLPEGWDTPSLGQSVTRREMARFLDPLLYHLTQYAMAEGTIIAFETDPQGTRWVHLETPLGEARLCLPVRGVVIQGGEDDSLREGVKVRTLSDAVGSRNGAYYRVRQVTIMPTTAQK